MRIGLTLAISVVTVAIIAAIAWDNGAFQPDRPLAEFLGVTEDDSVNLRGAIVLGVLGGLLLGVVVLMRHQTMAEQSLLIDHAREKIAVADEQVEKEAGFSAIWMASHTRLDYYHQLALDQSKRSFLYGILAAAAGLAAAVACAVVAGSAESLTGTLAAGGLGTMTTALSGYIGATFMRAYLLASQQLREYFEQAAESWRYLSAERLVEQIQDSVRRDAAVSELALRVVDQARGGDAGA